MKIQAILAAAAAAVRSVREPTGAWTRRSPSRAGRMSRSFRIEIEHQSYQVTVDSPKDPAAVESNGIEIPETVTRPRAPIKLLEDTYCRSPIAGRVVAVFAANGQVVLKNQPVLVIEAMKMEIQIGAPLDGTIKLIRVKPGESVHTNQLMFELE
jgi:biotin carboxyl carrier protein